MKKVQIPVCDSPFIVYVNGVKYIYPSGTEQEVPDDVADVIEQHDEYHKEKDRIDKEGDGSQGGGSGGGGYSTCKVHIASEVTDVRFIFTALENGKPTPKGLDIYTEGEYDIDVISGGYFGVHDTGMQGFVIDSDLQVVNFDYLKWFFVPADTKTALVNIFW